MNQKENEWLDARLAFTSFAGQLNGLETAKYRLLKLAGERFSCGADAEATILRAAANDLGPMIQNATDNRDRWMKESDVLQAKVESLTVRAEG